MIREPKFKVCRRLGDKVYGKCQSPKFATSLARKPVSKKKSRGGGSEFKTQLAEKQKTKIFYGVSERQFANYVRKAQSKKGANPSVELFKMLETRLDNIVFALGFLSSKPLARQVVTHGHMLVNGVRVDVPSYSVKVGDKISVRKGSVDSPLFRDLENRIKDKNLPSWVRFNKDKVEFEVVAMPTYDNGLTGFKLGDVIEFYSRA